MKMKTMAELEAENPEDFRNPAQTPEDEARDQRRWEERRIANESLPDEPDELEDEENEEEEEEEEDGEEE
jgi:hypothetical protein